jgi:hypothetical protein
MIAHRARLLFTCFAAALASLTACGGSPQAAKKSEPPPEPVSGRTALYRMYTMARGSWSKDALVVKLTSMRVPDLPEPAPGLSYAWSAVFAANGSGRSYTYSEIEQLPDWHKGSFAGPSEALSGTPFYIEGAKIDSDAAYQTAITKEAKEVAKNKGKSVTFLLELTSKFGEPVWRIVWGDSLSTATLSVFVGASTGSYLDTVH